MVGAVIAVLAALGAMLYAPRALRLFSALSPEVQVVILTVVGTAVAAGRFPSLRGIGA